jgi:hypothetical protein
MTISIFKILSVVNMRFALILFAFLANVFALTIQSTSNVLKDVHFNTQRLIFESRGSNKVFASELANSVLKDICGERGFRHGADAEAKTSSATLNTLVGLAVVAGLTSQKEKLL